MTTQTTLDEVRSITENALESKANELLEYILNNILEQAKRGKNTLEYHREVNHVKLKELTRKWLEDMGFTVKWNYNRDKKTKMDKLYVSW